MLARDPRIEALFDCAVVAFTSEVRPELIDELREEEQQATAPMAAGRMAEFATARACARAAMQELGVDAGVPRADSGAPQWPPGVTGSISHTRGFCLAVASVAEVAIGVDAEEVARMRPAIERRVLVDVEQRRVAELGDAGRQLRLGTIFAAKEAFYKAHYTIEPRYLAFDVIAVDIDGERLDFQPSSGEVAAQTLTRTVGKFLLDQGRVIAGVTINHSDS